MHRRDFIRVLGGGAILAATGCAPTGADPRAAWVDPGAGETDPRRKALSWAILAPNPHNMQPWIVDLSVPGAITLFIDRTRLLPVTDPFNRQIVIGCGAFLELLVMALSERAGLASTVELFPEGEPDRLLDDRPLFRVTTRAQGAAPAPLFKSVLQRRTNRGPFTNREVDQAAASNLLGAIKPVAGVTCNVTTAPDRLARLRELVYRGADVEAHTPAAHRESVERTFIGAGDVARHPWGISLDQPAMTAMNTVGILTKPKMATPGTIAFNEALKFLRTAADTSQGFLWIATAGDTRAEQIAAGRVYLLANLAATALELAMHPWSQGLQEYATQKPVYEALHRELSPGGGRLQMLARIGYPKAEVQPAPRRGLAAQLKAV